MEKETEEPNAEEAPATPTSEPAALARELEAARKRNEELLTRVQHLQAELENTRKRAEREMGQFVQLANEALVSQLLPVLDDLDAAVQSTDGEAGRGFALVRENLWKVLHDAGLEEIATTSGSFDPYLHECVEQVNDSDLPDGAIKDVLRKGYRFHMRVLRPSQVIVVRKEGENHG